MGDIATAWDIANGRGDWVQQGASLQTGGDLVNAILISLFTDRLAAIDDVIPDGSEDPRGWSGDLGQDYPIGSRLWLLSRAKQIPEVLRMAREYVIEALQWLIDDEVVAKLDLTVEFTRPGMLGIAIVAHKPAGDQLAMQFAYAWQGIN